MSVKRLDGREGLIVRGEKYLEIPKGPESSRPEIDTGARTGMIRFNTDSSIYEGFNGSTWVALVSGSWTILNSTQSPYTAVSGENILADTRNGPIEIRVQSGSFIGDSVHISGTGYEEINNIIVSDADTGTILETIVNNNSEIHLIRKSSSNILTDWQVVDLETFIANGTSKLEFETPNGALKLSSNTANETVDFQIDSGNLLLTNNNNPTGTSGIDISSGDILIQSGNATLQNGTITVGSGGTDTVVTSDLITVDTLLTRTNIDSQGTITAIGDTTLANLLVNGTATVSGPITGVTNTSNPANDEAASVALLNTSIANIDLSTFLQAGDGVTITAGTPDTIAVDLQANKGLSFNSGSLQIDLSALAASSVPADTDTVLMEVGGILSGVTRGDFLDGLNTIVRDIVGTVELNNSSDDGTADNTDIISPTGVGGVAPANGTEYIVEAVATDNTITGTAETYAAGDSIVWFNGAWIRIGAALPASGVLTFAGRGPTGGNITPAAGDYNAGLIQSTATTNIAATDVQAAIAEIDLEKAQLDDNNTFTGAANLNQFEGSVQVDNTLTAPTLASTTATIATANVTTLNATGTSTLNDTIVNGTFDVNNDITAAASVNVTGSIVLGTTPGSTTSKLSMPSGSMTAPSLYFGIGTNTGIFRGTANNKDVAFTAHGSEVGAFYGNGTTSAGLILEEAAGAAIAPTLVIQNDQSDNLLDDLNADIYIENFNPIIALRSKELNNEHAITLESFKSATTTFEINARTNTNNRLGNTEQQFLLINELGFRTFHQYQGISGTIEDLTNPLAPVPAEPSISFFDAQNTGLLVAETLPGSTDFDQFQVVVDGSNKITVRNNDIQDPSVVIEGTSSIQIPAGTVNERPNSTSEGQMRFNLDVNQFEGYNGVVWGPLGSQIGAVTVEWFLRNANFVALRNIGYMVDVSGGSIQVTLPGSAISGDFVWITDYKGLSSANPIVIVTPDATPIMDSIEDLIVASSNASLQLTYIDADVGWKITSGLGEIGNTADLVTWEVPKNSDFIAYDNLSYMVDTSTNSVTVTLPSPPTDPIEKDAWYSTSVRIADWAGTAPENNIVITSNQPINGDSNDIRIRTANAALRLAYIDDTQGWKVTEGSGSGGGAGIDNWEFINAATTPLVSAIAYDALMVDTSGGECTVVLPDNPSLFSIVTVMDHKGTCSVNPITVRSVNEAIVGDNEDVVINLDRAQLQFTYMGAGDSEGWNITSGVGEGGGGGSARDDWEIVSINTVAEIDGDYMVDTTSNAVLITLPTGPNINDNVKIADFKGTAFVNNITVLSPDHPIMGLPDALVINLNYATIQLTYIDSTQGWIITDGVGEGGSGAGSARVEWAFQDTDNFRMATDGAYQVETNTAELTMLLPENPNANDSVYIADYNGAASANPITVEATDGSAIMGDTDAATNFINIDLDWATVQITYIDATVGWKIVDGIGEGGGAGAPTPVAETFELTDPLVTDITFSSIAALTSAVYVNGVRLVPGIDYTVLNESAIRLLVTFPIGSILYAVQSDADAVPGNIWDFVTIEERQVIGSGQQTVVFTNLRVDGGPFSVYVNGIRLDREEYSVTNATTIELVSTYPSGSVILGVQNEPKNSATQITTSTADWFNNPLKLGTYTFWVDSTGDLRILNGEPTSDTDGAVVGTQS